jgi:ornithine cyclodeaminase/alanine dehydrogenase-like protein (mu-crystallin family)
MPAPIYITLEDTKSLVTVKDALEVSEQVFRWQAAGDVMWCKPPRFTMHGRAHPIYSHVKGAILEPIPIMGVRVVGYYIHPDGSGTAAPESTRIVNLIDPRTGSLLAIVDEHWNYSIRTTAAAVVGAKYLANPRAKTVGIVGAGNLAYTGLLALCETFPISQVHVTSRRPASYEGFARSMSEQLRRPVAPRRTVEEVCAEADIILVSTTAGQPLVFDRWVRPGVTLITLGKDEIEPTLYQSADKLVVDEPEEVQKSLGADVPIYASIEEVVSGKKAGRQRDDERVVIRTVGLVSQDIAIAHLAYRKAIAAGRGLRLG